MVYMVLNMENSSLLDVSTSLLGPSSSLCSLYGFTVTVILGSSSSSACGEAANALESMPACFNAGNRPGRFLRSAMAGYCRTGTSNVKVGDC